MRVPKIILVAGLVALVVLLLSPQRRPPAYNTAAEVTIRGVVDSVQNFYCPISGDEGTHLMVATANGTVQVHVAPMRFLGGRRWEFSQGDQVEVVGSPIVLHGRDALIARTISRGTQTVALRKPDGRPLWVE